METTPRFELTPTGKTVITDDLKENDNIATEEMATNAKEEFDTENKAFDENNFLVKVDLDGANILLDFLETKAKWKFRNAFGIVTCIGVVKKGIERFSKTKGLYLRNIELQAIAYFVAQHEDVGSSYAEKYIKMVEPLFETMQEATKWRNKVELLRQKYILYENSFEEQIPIEEVNLKELSKNENEIHD